MVRGLYLKGLASHQPSQALNSPSFKDKQHCMLVRGDVQLDKSTLHLESQKHSIITIIFKWLHQATGSTTCIQSLHIKAKATAEPDSNSKRILKAAYHISPYRKSKLKSERLFHLLLQIFLQVIFEGRILIQQNQSLKTQLSFNPESSSSYIS